ncbi:MAG: hypothetical protein ABJ215_10370 [Alphaproteobacteria bacterium]
MDFNSTSQVSTLIREPAPSPVAKPAAAVEVPAPATGTTGPRIPGEPVDQVQVSQGAESAPEPWVDRTPTEPAVDRTVPEPDRGARFDSSV